MASPLILHDLRLPLGHQPADLAELIALKAGRPGMLIQPPDYRIVRQSVDARHKSAIILQYSVELDPQPLVLSGIIALLGGHSGSRPAGPLYREPADRPVIVGAGPAGLFAALYLAMAGCRPILLEQGKPVEERQADVARYWQTGNLDPLSNVQFGEGGAGTFSDGKLTTGIKDARCKAILEELVLAGAPPDILFLARPHIGTDYLKRVVRQLRQKITGCGGEVWFGSRLAGIGLMNGNSRLGSLAIEQRQADGQTKRVELLASRLILAIGHSSRQTIRWLTDLPLRMSAKPFSLGVRIEHPQALIDQARYGRFAGHPQLPPADYKLACHLPSGRSVYTFCMCPGGQVVAAASQPSAVVTNGMSQYARSLDNANSALLVGVDPSDFPDTTALSGMDWQETLEQKAYACGGGSGRAPAERLGSFLSRPGRSQAKVSQTIWPEPQPTYKPGVNWCGLAGCLPPFILAALQEAIPQFDRRIPGFALPEAILTGLETRSSSPVRILRDANLQASLGGLYPCGEGAGFAGGIMSAAADGLRCAEAALHQA